MRVKKSRTFRNILITLFLCLCCVLCFGGCSSCVVGSTSSSEEQEPYCEVSFNVNALSMTIGEEEVLLVSYTQVAGAKLTLSSSDESIVTVNEYGQLLAISEGVATVTATYGDASATCEVTVGLGGNLPVLKMVNLPSDEVTIGRNGYLDLAGRVTFNGKNYDDVVLSYTLADDTIATIKDGVFTPKQTGTVEIAVVGTWRNVACETLTKLLTVHIQTEVEFYLNNGVNSLTLYTQAEEPQDFVVTAKANGENLTPMVEILSGEEYIDLDTATGKIAATGVKGNAEIKISCVVDETPYSMLIPVAVKQTVREYAKTVKNFSAIHGDVAKGIKLKTIMGGDFTEAYDADGNALEVKDGKVYGVPMSKTGKTETSITLCTPEYGYKINLEGYSGIIAKAEDFEVFDINVQYTKVSGSRQWSAIDPTKPMQVWDGYYVLANNIDASDYEHGANGYQLHTRGLESGFYHGLMGTFDGQGYTVRGMKLSSHGLFGYIVGGTVKNVAFTQVTLDAEAAYVATFACYLERATIVDTYIQIANTGELTQISNVVAIGTTASNITDCVFESNCTFAQSAVRSGSFISTDYARRDNNAATMSVYTNVYVISGAVAGYWQTSASVTEKVEATETTEATEITYTQYTNYYFVAENVTDEPVRPDGETEKTWLIKVFRLEGVWQYADKTQWASSTNSYETFNAEVWDLTSGLPVFKTVNFTVNAAQEYVEKFNPNWLKA